MNNIWAKTVDAATRYNDPGTFTTFAGYEFTAMRPVSADPDVVAAANLHRNVIFRDEAPEQLFTTLNSPNPEDLWAWMDKQRADGIDSLAIPTIQNASNGWMFAQETYAGGPMDAGYIKRAAPTNLSWKSRKSKALRKPTPLSRQMMNSLILKRMSTLLAALSKPPSSRGLCTSGPCSRPRHRRRSWRKPV